MTANERRACDGLLDDDAPISDSMEQFREHVERLQWELYAAANTLREAAAKLREKEAGK